MVATSANIATITFSAGEANRTCAISTGSTGAKGDTGSPGPNVKLAGIMVGAKNAAAALVTADLTNDEFGINDSVAKTLTEASCVSDSGDQAVTVKSGLTTLFTIHCVGRTDFDTNVALGAAAVVDGSVGLITAANMTNTAVAARKAFDLSGTANTTTKVVALHIYATVQ